MKKSTTLFMGLLLTFGLAGCGSNQPPAATAPSLEPGSETSAGPKPASSGTGESEAAGTGAAGGKTLVVYYSASGNTKKAGDFIAKAANADVFELVPAAPYSDDDLNWRDDNSRVVYEHDNPDARDVELSEETVPDWESYDTVFIGYPIWWGIAAWPVDGFIKANDFTGKTVIPFCTSSSSGLGESGELLAELAGTGNWLKGERFTSGVSKETVQEWVESLE